MIVRREKNRADGNALIDLTPVVNISLILVIVFMCVSPMALVTGIKAVNSGDNSNKADLSLGKSSKDEVVKIVLEQNGRISINGVFIEKRLFFPSLKDTIMMSPKKEVMITADNKNKVQEVVNLIDISKQYGATKVILAE